MNNIDRLLQDYMDTYAAVRDEELRRKEVMQSPQWCVLQERIDAMCDKQKELLQGIPDSTAEHAMDRIALFKKMNEEQTYAMPGYDVRTRVTKSVNTNKVLAALDGDLDQFFLLASVTQAALSEYGKLHRELTRPLKDCIEIESEIVMAVHPLPIGSGSREAEIGHPDEQPGGRPQWKERDPVPYF